MNGEALDHEVRGNLTKGAEVPMQRSKSLGVNAHSGNWQMARHLELLPTDRGERQMAASEVWMNRRRQNRGDGNQSRQGAGLRVQRDARDSAGRAITAVVRQRHPRGKPLSESFEDTRQGRLGQRRRRRRETRGGLGARSSSRARWRSCRSTRLWRQGIWTPPGESGNQ